MADNPQANEAGAGIGANGNGTGASGIEVIGDSALLTGFKLAGVQKLHLTQNPQEAEAMLIKILDAGDAGIVIIDESLLESFDWRLKRRVEAAAKPVVVTVPSRAGPMEQTESLGMLIKRALGFDIMGKDKKKEEKKQ